MDANRRQLERTPVTFPLAAPTVLTLALRDLIETDPPITINLPQIFFESLVGRVEVEVSDIVTDPWTFVVGGQRV